MKFFKSNMFWSQFPSPDSSQILPTSWPTQLHALSFSLFRNQAEVKLEKIYKKHTYKHNP